MDIITYITDNFPNVIAKNINLSEYKNNNALGFIITNDKLIIGYVDKNGNLKKMLNPMDISDFDISLIKEKIPTVYSASLSNLEILLDNAKQSNKKQIDKKIFTEDQVPFVLYDELNKKYILLKKEYEDEVVNMLNDNKKILENKESCIKKITTEHDIISSKVKEYVSYFKNMLLDKNKTIQETRELYNTVIKEQDELKKRLGLLNNMNSEKLDDLYQQIDKISSEFKNEEFKNQFILKSFDKCKTIIKDEKDIIIEKIKLYKQAMKKYISSINKDNQDELINVKQKMMYEYNIIKNTLDNIQNQSQEKNKSIRDLNTVLNETISKNLIQLNTCEDKINDCIIKNKELTDKLLEKDEKIQELQLLLNQTKNLLNDLATTNIKPRIDYNKCQNTLYTFISLNNTFKRKLEIIEQISVILDKKEKLFNLTYKDKVILDNIKIKFINVSNDIVKYITFLDLEKYINSIYLEYFKNESTIDKIPVTFCEELDNLILYWNQNIDKFKEQDRLLTNIYEDLSNSVRIYIRIKPNFENNQALDKLEIINQVFIKSSCNIQKTFGPFYGIFDETQTNFDIYTGTNLPQISEYKVDIPDDAKNYKGLYNVFNQIEDEYNIMLFGYGISGSGKSHSLLGSGGILGLLHYGLGNLKNIKEIKIQHMFEQYQKLVNINFNQMTGSIINLIGNIPSFSKFSKDESKIFLPLLNDKLIDPQDIYLKDLDNLLEITNVYRKSKNRIRKTPNNNESSRSHLYIVFTVLFNNGKTGNLTIIDTAGGESPTEIYNTLIDKKISLPTILSPLGGQDIISKGLYPQYRNDYTSLDVYNLLKESFYINESLNHLIYYFNQKNNIDMPIYHQSNSLSKYNSSKFYVSPKSEMTFIKEGNNCLTIPIMQYLDSLNNTSTNTFKPSKFVMICNIREELEYCEGTLNTLEFANSIKSS
jgi:hypothetical protein